MTSEWTRVGAHRVHAREWLDAATPAHGLTIVLVHGLGVSSRYMVPAGERLGASRRVHALDLPGFGRSRAHGAPLTIPEHARVLGDWMRARDITEPVLVGHSFGCQVVTELLVQRPGWIRGVVLAAPTIEASRRSLIGEMLRLASDGPLERPRLWPIVAADYLRAGARRCLFTLRDALADRIEDKLPHVTVPTLLLRGSRDPIVSDDWIDFLRRRTAFGTAVTLPGAPHALNFSTCDAFCAEVERHVARVSGEFAAA